MSCNKKISIIILGNDFSTKSLMAYITGKDFSALSKRDHPKGFQIYENDMYEFIAAPDTGCEEVREIFSENPHPDFCLVVAEERFSEQDVWSQIESLHRTTGKSTDEFVVVLPKGHPTSGYIFKSWTADELLRKLIEHSYQKPNKNSADDLHEKQRPLQPDEEEMGIDYFHGKFTPTKVNLVLLGMAGTGKSSTGNTILGKKHFFSKISSKSVTTECQMAETEINGTRVRVIDTPDIFDYDIESSVRREHVAKCEELCESGPRVYLLVMHVSRFTDGEKDVLQKLEKAFGSTVKEQTIIVFTRGDDLHRAGMSFDEFVKTRESDLRNMVDKCGGRCVLFENSNTNSGQVTKLMDKVDMLRQQI